MGTFQMLYALWVSRVTSGQGQAFSDGLRMSHGIGRAVKDSQVPAPPQLPRSGVQMPDDSHKSWTGLWDPPDAPPSQRRGQEAFAKRALRKEKKGSLRLPWGRNQPLWACGGDGGAWLVCFSHSHLHKARAGRAEPGGAAGSSRSIRAWHSRPGSAIYWRHALAPGPKRSIPAAPSPGAGDAEQHSPASPAREPSPSFSSHISSLPSITACPCHSATAAVTRLWLRERKMSRLSAAEPRTCGNTRQINEVREIRVHKSQGCKSSCGCSYSEVKKSECRS